MAHNETVPTFLPCAKPSTPPGHPALLMVDTISGLASADYRHDEWGVDVTISGSQKGLMLPPGLGFNALSPRAIEASKTAKLPKSYWAWDEIIEMNKTGYFPYTPATNLLYGLHEALEMIEAEGLDKIFARHKRWSAGVRGAVEAWGLAVQCADKDLQISVLTSDIVPASTPTSCARPSWSVSTCRWARGWASSRAAPSASAIWATATT